MTRVRVRHYLHLLSHGQYLGIETGDTDTVCVETYTVHPCPLVPTRSVPDRGRGHDDHPSPPVSGRTRNARITSQREVPDTHSPRVSQKVYHPKCLHCHRRRLSTLEVKRLLFWFRVSGKGLLAHLPSRGGPGSRRVRGRWRVDDNPPNVSTRKGKVYIWSTRRQSRTKKKSQCPPSFGD